MVKSTKVQFIYLFRNLFYFFLFTFFVFFFLNLFYFSQKCIIWEAEMGEDEDLPAPGSSPRSLSSWPRDVAEAQS